MTTPPSSPIQQQMLIDIEPDDTNVTLAIENDLQHSVELNKSASEMDADDTPIDSSQLLQPQRVLQQLKRRLPQQQLEHDTQPNKKTRKLPKWKESDVAASNSSTRLQRKIAAARASAVSTISNTKLQQKVAANPAAAVANKPNSKLQQKVDKIPVGVLAPKSSLDEIKMVYVSPFPTDVTEDDVMDHLLQNKSLQNIVDKIECVKLVKKDVAVEDLSFVSFGLKVPKRYTSFLTHKSIWPSTVFADDFIENQKPGPIRNSRVSTAATYRPSKPQSTKNQKPWPKNQRNRPTKAPLTQQTGQSKPQMTASQMMAPWLSMLDQIMATK